MKLDKDGKVRWKNLDEQERILVMCFANAAFGSLLPQTVIEDKIKSCWWSVYDKPELRCVK